MSIDHWAGRHARGLPPKSVLALLSYNAELCQPRLVDDDDPETELQYLIATAIVATSLVYGIFRAMVGLTS